MPQERYAELLIADIPPRARLDVFLDLYRESEHWQPDHMRVFLKVLLGSFSDDEIRQICEVLTEDLKSSDDEATIRAVLGAFPSTLWPRIGEVARLRVENKLIRSVRDGRYESGTGRCRSGALGTWSTSIFAAMTLKNEMIEAIAEKLWSTSSEERGYVFRYIFSSMRRLSDTMPQRVASALYSRLKSGDVEAHEQLDFSPPWDELTWPEDLRKAYASFQAKENANDFNDDIHF